MNIALLDRIRDAAGQHVPWPSLQAEFGQVEVETDLSALEAFGYQIERHPYLGVAYRGPAARLSPDQIEWRIGTQRIGRRIAVWNRVTSTNDLAAKAAASRANDGLVILAEEQTHGRGRRGRPWTAPRGECLLLSVLVFPPPPLAAPGWLTALGAVAVAEVAEAMTGRDARIKWPNDVRVGARKIAGILVERSAGAVVGIGLNVNLRSDALPEPLRERTSSLAELTGATHDRSDVARCLIRRLDALYAIGHELGPAPLDESWKTRLEWLGRKVHVDTCYGEVRGLFAEASLLQGVRIDSPDGSSCRVAGSDVLSVRLAEPEETAGE